MILAYICAGFGFASMYLYALRIGHVWKGLIWPERAAGLMIVVLLMSLAIAFIDVARAQEFLLWRQKLVFVALAGLAVSLLWPRRRHPYTSSPR